MKFQSSHLCLLFVLAFGLFACLTAVITHGAGQDRIISRTPNVPAILRSWNLMVTTAQRANVTTERMNTAMEKADKSIHRFHPGVVIDVTDAEQKKRVLLYKEARNALLDERELSSVMIDCLTELIEQEGDE